MGKAIQVQLVESGNTVIVHCGYGRWIDKIGAGAVGAVLFMPLAATAAFGAVTQSRIPAEIFDETERFILSGGKSVIVPVGQKWEPPKPEKPTVKRSGLHSEKKTLPCAALVLFFLSGIFSITPMFRVSSIYGGSENLGMFPEGSVVKTILLLCYLVSFLSAAAPLIWQGARKPAFFLPAKITAAAAGILFLLQYLSAAVEVGKEQYRSIFTLFLSPFGWLFLLSLAGSLILLFITASRAKREDAAGVADKQLSQPERQSETLQE